MLGVEQEKAVCKNAISLSRSRFFFCGSKGRSCEIRRKGVGYSAW
jgi:hypothetical protein